MNADAARRLREYIIAQKAGGRSYHRIAREDFPGVSHATIQRIAKENHFPKGKEILKKLGLTKLDEAQAYGRHWKRTFTRLLKELQG